MPVEAEVGGVVVAVPEGDLLYILRRAQGKEDGQEGVWKVVGEGYFQGEMQWEEGGQERWAGMEMVMVGLADDRNVLWHLSLKFCSLGVGRKDTP